MADDFEVANGPVRLRVDGLRKVGRNLAKSGADASDMKDLMHSLGMLIVRAAHVPEVSGRLASSLRAGRGKTKAVVRAGGARAPYAGVNHYGDPARGIAPNPYLVNAVRSERADILQSLDVGIEEILRKNDLL